MASADHLCWQSLPDMTTAPKPKHAGVRTGPWGPWAGNYLGLPGVDFGAR